MPSLSEIDAKIGKHVFHPPVILLCQYTNQSQYAIYRSGWFLWAMWNLYTLPSGTPWFLTTFLFVAAFIFMAALAVRPDKPLTSNIFIRVAWVILLLDEVVGLVAMDNTWQHLVGPTIVVFSEYAATIKTIPPRPKKQAKTSARKQTA
jgi:hypothetical protein